MSIWLKDAPIESGWYWYKHDPFLYPDLPDAVARPILLMVYTSGPNVRAMDTVNGEDRAIGEYGGYWNGPLTPPEFDVPLP